MEHVCMNKGTEVRVQRLRMQKQRRACAKVRGEGAYAEPKVHTRGLGTGETQWMASMHERASMNAGAKVQR